jgi:hypothetical protein
MQDWIQNHHTILLGLIGLSAITLIASLFLVPLMVVRVPADYFTPDAVHHTPFGDKHPLVRILLIAGKNLLGLLLVILGILMLVLPGQGVLTVLAGLVLLDIPGRRRALEWIASRRPVLASMNWIRERAGHEPLLITPRESGGSAR